MLMRISLIASLALVTLPASGPAHAQDFLGGLARRAAASAAAQAIGRAVSNPRAPDANAPTSTTEQPAPSARRAPADDAPEAEGLQGLPEAEREKACDARTPRQADGGRNMEQQNAFIRCMGPRYGDGG